MNTRERFIRVLMGWPVDRVPFIKVFGGTNDVLPHWEKENPGLSQRIDELLGFEGADRGWAPTSVNVRLSRRKDPQVLEETDTRRVVRHTEGTISIVQKGADYHYQTVEWPVKGWDDWERIKAEHLQPDDPERFPVDWPEQTREYACRDYPLQLTHGGVYGFARNMMGDERLLYAFYDDPVLVHDMFDTYTDMVLVIWRKMIQDVAFDLIECWEDMASKHGALISSEMFREFMSPNYEKIASFAKEHEIESVLVDSDGYIDDLAEVMIEAGVTAMYPFEVGAGCNVREVRERYPDLGIIGGLDKQAMARGKKDIDKEVEKSREYIRMGHYIPGPDHFVLSDVSWTNYRYFMERLREVVMTTRPEVQPA